MPQRGAVAVFRRSLRPTVSSTTTTIIHRCLSSTAPAAAAEISKNDKSYNNLAMNDDNASNHSNIPIVTRTPMRPATRAQSRLRSVPPSIEFPPYAKTGFIPPSQYGNNILIHSESSVARMRTAAQLARDTLDAACAMATPPSSCDENTVFPTTDDIDRAVHERLLAAGAYPSPLNYAGFPKSLCSSVNEVICHGIPDGRRLQFGDVVSFDVSCYVGGVHGDNCATVIVGDTNHSEQGTDTGVDWRGVPYRTTFARPEDAQHFAEARRLVQATREGLYAGIDACKPGGCLSHIGHAIQDVAEHYGYSSVEKYQGHGIADEFHIHPFVKHYRNDDRLELKPGMIFTIEPMFTAGNSSECYEWDDDWTVAAVDGSLSAQFEHTVYITESGVEILTLPSSAAAS